MNSRLALIVFLDSSGNYPDNSLPGIPVYPDQGLPGSQPGPDNSLPGGRPPHPWFPGHRPNRPDQGLPGGGYPGQGRPDQGLPPFATQLPVFPFDPSKPPSNARPDNDLPLREGQRFEVKWSPYYGFVLVPVDGPESGGGKPDQGLPGEQPGIDNSLPGSQPGVDNSLPPETAQPKPSTLKSTK